MKIGENIRAAINALRGKNDMQHDTVVRVQNMIDNRVSPAFTFGRDIYNVPEIRTAINFVATKFAQVKFNHVQKDNKGGEIKINDGVNSVLNVRSNVYQSPTKFCEDIITRLLLDNNVYILPQYDAKGMLKALTPMPFVNPIISPNTQGEIIITFNGEYQFFYDDIIHLTRFSHLKFGEKMQAQGDYVEVGKSIQKQIVQESENSGRIQGILKSTMPLNDKDANKKLKEFEDRFLSRENVLGLGILPNTFSLEKVDIKSSTLNPNTLKFITESLYNYYGVSVELISNKAQELEYEQFIDNIIKLLVKHFCEELTYKLFTSTEILKGHCISANTTMLEISTLSAKTTFLKEGNFAGYINGNEARAFIGMSRGSDELDTYRPNLNSVAAEKINEYQGVKDDDKKQDK